MILYHVINAVGSICWKEVIEGSSADTLDAHRC